MVALGPEKSGALLPEILAKAADSGAAAEVREGYLGLFVYLPGVMKLSFGDLIPQGSTLRTNSSGEMFLRVVCRLFRRCLSGTPRICAVFLDFPRVFGEFFSFKSSLHLLKI